MEVIENLLKSDIGESLSKLQNDFIKSNFGELVNDALDKTLRKMLPNSIEQDVIDIKDAFLEQGFKNGIDTAIDKAIETGQNILKIFKGEFDSIEDLRGILREGKLKDKVSDVFDFTLKRIEKSGILEDNVISILKIGKNILSNSLEEGVDDNLTNQMKSMKDIEQYIEKWNLAYKQRNFENMQKIYNDIQEEYENIMPIKNIIDKINVIDNIQTLIENNGHKFNLTETQELLSKIL